MGTLRGASKTALLVYCLTISASALPGAVQFEDITADSGLVFRHDNGLSGDWHYPEIVGGGCGLVDYDGDGRLDIVLVQSGAVPNKRHDAEPPVREATRLYRNASSSDRIRFVDVTAESGLDARGYGMGVAAGDLTGNGHPDLYITNYGPNSLWRNNGDGSFTDISESSGTAHAGFGASASVADIDSDGRLDLFVTNYVDYDPESNPTCLAESTRRDYCGPGVFEAARDVLYLNQGNGRFDDATMDWLGDHPPLRGLGVAVVDLDGDGRRDVFVANDGDMNQFWRNEADRFSEQALLTGTAVNRHGQMEAGMGIAVADVDGDGDWDLLLTHLTGESNTLYRNRGQGDFFDDTAAWGLHATTLPFTGFGVALADFDRDALPDLMIANGAVRVIEAQRQADSRFPLSQRDLMLRNTGSRRFEQVMEGDPALAPAVGRGLATGDIDNDGRLDVLICNNHDRPRLLHNRAPTTGKWLGVRLVTGEPSRDALGAEGRLTQGQGQRQRAATDGSYLSARDARLLFALQGEDEAASVDVTWADGTRERFEALSAGSYHTLVQGEGQRPAP
ncbi:CRTAC1 family protein [Wenzhouxiangella sediminis]|uniref:CRTAC1 family protein n=1 Tax=Wenzhouxiangella sediminis TaxID=1792836 RepID=A0A3E1KD09_9GAMM|nr:CRTAC1 family protein [Wenzhouxiangella sediminis]RFF33007.1 CRTAC1 family protein [Wenzhouxiangella sediminis]